MEFVSVDDEEVENDSYSSEDSFRDQQNDGLESDNEMRECLAGTSTASDEIFSVDYILVFEKKPILSQYNLGYTMKRNIFEQNLRSEGLNVQRDPPNERIGLNYVKIHVKLDTCRQYCEELRIRMPVKKVPVQTPVIEFDEPQERQTLIDSVSSKWNYLVRKYFSADPNMFPPSENRFTLVYRNDREFLFDVNSPDFFTPPVRSLIAGFILQRMPFSDFDGSIDTRNNGIKRLIRSDLYCSQYPLHENFLEVEGSKRHNLYEGWASLRNVFKCQPLNYVKEYFGKSIAFYFAWLGFYTYMLIFPTVIGLLCLAHFWIMSFSNVYCDEICNPNATITMCPLCDYNCGFWNIRDSCMYCRTTYSFDNTSTVIFSVFMCIWCSIFLEFWKRYSHKMTHRWDLDDFDIRGEYPRPKFLSKMKNVRRTVHNSITGWIEPAVPFWTMRLPMTALSASGVIFLVALTLAVVIGVVMYRFSVLAAFRATQYGPLLTSVSAAFVNLLLIFIFDLIYPKLAKYLTEYELHRTQTEFDDALAFKMYLLSFVNNYSSIIYVAFFEGKFTGSPNHNLRIFNHRFEDCKLGNCSTDLWIQLATIMIGKPIFNGLLENLKPLVLVKKFYF